MLRVSLFLIATASAAFSQTTATDLSACAEIAVDASRLACFDALAAVKAPTEAGPDVALVPGTGKWQVSRTKNPVDDTETVIVTLVADNGVSNFGRPVAVLVRCQSNQTELFISWGDYLASDGDYNSNYKNVLTRIGSKAAATTKWSTSTDQTATFAPDAVGLLRTMAASDNFVAQVTPYNASPITAVFDTSGIKSALKPINEVCGWTLEPS